MFFTSRLNLLSQRQSASQTQAKRREAEKEKRKVKKSILEKINISITCDPLMADAWFKAIENVTDSEETKPLDLLVLFNMYKIKSRRKVIENLLKSKIRNGVFTSTLISTTFEKHPAILAEDQLLSDVLQIAANLINCPV